MRTSITLGTSGTVELFEDIPCPTTYQISDIKNPDRRQGSYTKTINIPGSKTNDRLFAHIFEIDIDCRFNPNIRTPCVLSVDGLEQLNGHLKLIRIKSLDDNKKEYECSIIGSVSNIFTVMSDKELTHLDMSEYNHVYNKTNQKASWTATVGEGYVYPLIDYGYSNGLTYAVENMYPAIYVKEYVDKIFSYTGFTYESNFLTSNLFKRLIIPFNSDALRLSDASVLERLFTANIGSSGTVVLSSLSAGGSTNEYASANYVPYNAESSDVSNQFDTTTYQFTAQDTGSYNLQASFNYQLNSAFAFAPAGWVFLLKYSASGVWTVLANNSFSMFGGISNTSRTATINVSSVDLLAGDKVFVSTRLTASASGTPNFNMSGGTFFNSVNNIGLYDGNDVDMNSAIPQKVKLKDFFMSIVKMFNLYIEVDKLNANKLYIEPRNDFYANGVVKDWTSKLDLSQNLDIEPMGELDARKYVFKYKEDKDYYNEKYQKTYIDTYGTYNKDINNEFVTGIKETSVIFSPTPLVNDGGTDRTIPEIYSTDSLGNISPKISNIRILYYGGEIATTYPWTYTGALSGTTTEATYPYAGHLDSVSSPTIDLSFGVPREVYYTATSYTNNHLYNAYYKQFIEEITDKDSKVVTGYFYLTPVDIFTLDFRNEYFVDGHFLRLNKVYDYDPVRNQLTKCEFLKIKNAQTFVGGTGLVYATLGGENMPNPIGSDLVRPTVSAGNPRSMGNYVSTSTRASFVSGTRNNIGSGTENITLLNSSGCTVLAGVHGVTLINTSGVTVGESDVLMINNVATPSIYQPYSNITNVSGSSYNIKVHDGTLLVTTGATNTTINLSFGFPQFVRQQINYGIVGGNVSLDLTKVYNIKKVDSGVGQVIIDPSGSGTIDGSSTATITSQYDSLTIQYDGTNWHII